MVVERAVFIIAKNARIVRIRDIEIIIMLGERVSVATIIIIIHNARFSLIKLKKKKHF